MEMKRYDSNKKTRKNLTNDFNQHIMKQRIDKPMIKSSKLILLFREPTVGVKAAGHGSVNGLMRAKRKVYNRVVFDGISARYQGNIRIVWIKWAEMPIWVVPQELRSCPCFDTGARAFFILK